VLFDALAFNDALRRIDTIGDLAFTFMDLHARGLPRLAWRFIGTALEACGDQEAVPLLAWWAVYRAAVRAKVVLLGAAGSGAAAAQALSRRYLEVALHLAGLAGTPATPRLVQMVGLSGAGKSRIAGLLVERLAAGADGWGGALRLRSDVERKRLFALAPTARGSPGLYSEVFHRRTYDRLLQLARVALEAGVSVVIDAASLRRRECDAMRCARSRRATRSASRCWSAMRRCWCCRPGSVGGFAWAPMPRTRPSRCWPISSKSSNGPALTKPPTAGDSTPM
jgi:hypothetical protein